MSRTVNHLFPRDERDAAVASKGKAQTACGLLLRSPRLGLELPTCKQCENVVDKLFEAAATGWDEGANYAVRWFVDSKPFFRLDNPYRQSP